MAPASYIWLIKLSPPHTKKFEPATQLFNPHFQESHQKMLNETKNGTAVIVYLNGFSWRNYYPSLANIENELDSNAYLHYRDQVGVIFTKKE